jgi:putative protease
VDIAFKSELAVAVDEDGNTVQLSFAAGEAARQPERMLETIRTQLGKSGESDFFVGKIDFAFSGAVPFFSLAELNKLRRDLLEKLMFERLKNYKPLPARKISYAKYPKDQLDYRANVYNEKARKFYRECGAQILENAFETDKSHNPENKVLMTTRHCLKYAFNMCKTSKQLYLVDRHGLRRELAFDCDKCEMSIK